MMAPKARRHGAGAALFFVFLVTAWLLGLWRFAGAIPASVADPNTKTDAIVVLTGGSKRVDKGLQLLAEGKAKKLFVSGVYRGVDVTALLRVSRQEPESLTCCIALGHSADNTEGNARETAAWMTQQGFRSLRLVTANYHMPRSLLEFARAMPEIKIIPNPVFPAFMTEGPWWRSRAAAAMVVSEYNKYLFALVRPILPGTPLLHGSIE